jgi:hypothetical protein
MADPQAIDTEAIARSISETLGSLLGRQRPTDDDDYDGVDSNKKVPYHRFQKYANENKELRQQLEALSGKVNELGQGYRSQVDAIKAEAANQVEQLKARAAEDVTKISQHHSQELALHDVGLTDVLGRNALRQAYEMLPQDGRPDSPLDYYQSLLSARAAHAADPESAEAPQLPKTLVAYLPEVQAAAPAKGPASPPNPNKGAQPRGRRPSVEEVRYDPERGMAGYIEDLKRAEG